MSRRSTYASILAPAATPQSEPVVGKPMIANSAGGFVFAVDDFTRLSRWLILGSEGGSYYASERKLTLENAQCVLRCAAQDFDRTLKAVVDISVEGRAPKNDEAIFALALLSSNADPAKSAKALASLPQVCRIGTHLFAYIAALKGNHLRGMGRSVRTALSNWYLNRSPMALANQLTKYQQREGWSHRDVLRLARPKVNDPMKNALLAYAVGKPKDFPAGQAADYIAAVEETKAQGTTPQRVCELIRQYSVPRECINTEKLNNIDVWAALLESMPPTALVRNLGKMTSIGLIKPLSEGMKKAVTTLTSMEALKNARVHPYSLLIAKSIYCAGRGFKGSLTWSPVPSVEQALDDAFYLSFGVIEPTNKNWLLALDVSGSMEWTTFENTFITPRQAAAAMSLVATRTEPWSQTVAFASGTMSSRGYGSSVSRVVPGVWNGITPLNFSRSTKLEEAVTTCAGLFAGGTDCALPILYAMEKKLEVDVFVIFTDNETWAGDVHPFVALREYRQRMSRYARMIVVGMVSNGFTIADPSDPGMLDVVGFDSSAPQVMSQFALGNI